jgi:SHO1 osmosensor
LPLTVEQLAWLIAFIASIISDVREVYPNYAWWALVYMFFCIGGVTMIVGADAERTYNVAVRSTLQSFIVHVLTSPRSPASSPQA